MAQIVIEVPDEVYQRLKAMAAYKFISFEDLYKVAFAAGVLKLVRVKFKE